jgi:NCAIR mutase (PurE)-related protein
MDDPRLRALLAGVAGATTPVDEAVSALRRLPFETLGYAHLDHHRALRQGFPEVVFGQGKTAEQLVGLARATIEAENTLLVTRVEAPIAERVRKALAPAELSYDPTARSLFHEPRPRVDRGRGVIAIVSAGTSDMPVTQEAALTAELMGNRVDRIFDVGVAGLHRLLSHHERLLQASVVVVVAGMEGALPSVVGGLVGRPVIAVPTSIGYGASLGGIAALLGMLNSCAAGVTVVNIDNGFGAGYAAALINRRDPAESVPPHGVEASEPPADSES